MNVNWGPSYTQIYMHTQAGHNKTRANLKLTCTLPIKIMKMMESLLSHVVENLYVN